MRKIAKAFWYGIFWVGTALANLGDKIIEYGLDKLDAYQRKY